MTTAHQQAFHSPEWATGAGSVETAPLCANCRIRSSNICRVLLAAAPAGQPRAQGPDWQLHGTTRARRNIKSAGERLERTSIICEGWACLFAQLRDGRRQILSILIPGDVIAPTTVFGGNARFSVQALTDVRFCGFARAVLRNRLHSDAELFEAWANLIVAERGSHHDLLINLGSRLADERIAYLLLALRARLVQRGVAGGSVFEFPLTQRHIAEATGLTPEHVSRVISALRRQQLVDACNGSLRIIDLAGLERIGRLDL